MIELGLRTRIDEIEERTTERVWRRRRVHEIAGLLLAGRAFRRLGVQAGRYSRGLCSAPRLLGMEAAE